MLIISIIAVCIFSQNSLKAGEIIIYGDSFIVKYRAVNIIYKGKKVTIPIFGGSNGELDDQKLLEDHKNIKVKSTNQLIMNLAIPVKKGSVKKTFLDILNFYKQSLLKDINIEIPSVVGFEECGGGKSPAIIWYDFNYNGFHSSIQITVWIKDYTGYWDSSEFIEKDGAIFISIYIDRESGFIDGSQEWIEYYRGNKKFE